MQKRARVCLCVRACRCACRCVCVCVCAYLCNVLKIVSVCIQRAPYVMLETYKHNRAFLCLITFGKLYTQERQHSLALVEWP